MCLKKTHEDARRTGSPRIHGRERVHCGRCVIFSWKRCRRVS